MKQTLRKLAITLALTSAVATTQAQKLDLSYMRTGDGKTSRFRPELTAELPGKVNSYTFVDFYSDGQNYLGKTVLSKHNKKGIGVRAEVSYSSSKKDQADIGIAYNIKKGKTSIGLKYLPLNVNAKGETNLNHTIGVQFSSQFNLPVFKEVDLSGFAFETNNKNAVWQYGEVTLSKDFGALAVGVGVDLYSNGTITPTAKPHARITYHVK